MANFPMVPGHEVTALIHRGRRSLVYRARNTTTGEMVLLKTLSEAVPLPESVAQTKREFAVTARLCQEVDGVIGARGLIWVGDRPFMALEDIGGESLARIMNRSGLDLAANLRLIARVASILDNIHAINVVHKDINPSNIVANLHSGALRLIDFGSASEISRETPNFCAPSHIEGTLAYVSPEQTGRMNRVLDYRSDYYSLGVTAYQLLTKRLPFESDDPVELLHAHVARLPEPPHRVNPKVPEAVSRVVLKLMAKNADERYQSASGLVKDLEQFVLSIEQNRSLDGFEPGRFDSPRRFRIAQKLYGRQAEIEKLMATFERISHGPAEIMLIGGYSGIGKTALVHEVHKPITRQRGFYVAGKFDQLQRNVPYSALLHALTDLVDQRLTEPEESLAHWRAELLAAMGDRGQVIIELLPIAELLIGPQPPVPSLGPAEAERRFHQVFKQFLQVFCSEAHPLVIFVDDLQWADSATLGLLLTLMTARDLHHLLLIGAYRDNEVDDSHPLMRTLRALERGGACVTTLSLSPLRLADIAALVVDTLGGTEERVAELAALLFEKTQGNAFFLTQFLKSLHDDGLLTKAPKAAAAGSGDERAWEWVWDIATIRERDITENVVDLMARKIARLPDEQQRLLKSAACLGNSFDLRTLCAILQTDERQLSGCLRPILEEGLLLPLDEHYKLVTVAEGLSNSRVCAFRFLHDRVQEAAYTLIPEPLRPRTHLAIGRLLRRSTPDRELEERIFEIVWQLDEGLQLIDDPEEAAELARLNLLAGRKAKAAMAHSTAIDVLQAGIEVLERLSPWEEHFELVFDLHEALALCEYLTSRFAAADSHFQMLCDKARTPMQIGRVYGEAVYLHTTMNEYGVAIRLTREGLKRLGMDFPAEVTGEILAWEFARAEETLAGRKIASLYHLPEIIDPVIVAPFDILNMAIPPCWLAEPPGFAWCTLQMVNLSQLHGNTRISSFGYAIYALLLCGAPQRFQQALEYGELAIELNQRFPDVFIEGTIHFFFSCFVQHWRRHKRLNGPAHDIAHRRCIEGGANVYGVYNVIFFFFQSFYADVPLDRVREQYVGYVPVVKQIGDRDVLGVLYLLLQLVDNFEDRTESGQSLDGDEFNERAYLAELESRGYGNGLCYYHLVKLIACFFTEQFDEALAAAARLVPNYVYSHGLYHQFLFHFFRALAVTAVLPAATGARANELAALLAEDRRLITMWAEQCPDNFEHQRVLLLAEIARVEGQYMEALRLYHRAVELAGESQCLASQALAHELAAKVCLAQGLEEYAGRHAAQATSAYAAWGATRKLATLRVQHPQLFALGIKAAGLGQRVIGAPPAPEPEIIATVGVIAGTPSTTKHEQLDLISLLKASHAIAQEVTPGALMTKILSLSVEHAGASRGVLVLQRDSELWVEAELDTSDGRVTISPHPVETSERVPTKIVLFVCRKAEAVHFERDTEAPDARFSDDPYFARRQVHSVLCAPIELERRCTGVLYLENDIAEGSLTKRSLEVLRILATQAAISLRNAFHITRLEETRTDLMRRNEELQVQRQAIAALSVPLIEVGDGLMAVPLIGVLDAERIDRVTTSLLEEVSRRQTRVVLVDMTGIDAIDEVTAHHLIQLSRMLRLLGTRMILTGIRARVVQTVLKWGRDLTDLESYANLKGALAKVAGQTASSGAKGPR